MRLLYAAASPFSAKVRMAASVCDIALIEELVDTMSEPERLVLANPLGKIPAMLLDDGSALFDSPAICEYLDRLSGNRIVPQRDAGWLHAKRVEALADGVTDAAVLVLYEGRFRPDEKRHEPWVERQWRKVSRGLDALESEVREVAPVPTVGDLSLAALLGWLDLRFEGRWEAGRPRLCNWKDGFFDAFPALAELRPKA